MLLHAVLCGLLTTAHCFLPASIPRVGFPASLTPALSPQHGRTCRSWSGPASASCLLNPLGERGGLARGDARSSTQVSARKWSSMWGSVTSSWRSLRLRLREGVQGGEGVGNTTVPQLRQMYAAGDSSEKGELDVGEGHVLHYRIYGNPNATATALFLHGGPGAGCFPNHARFFDPERYRVVLFDQRGCGSSTPKGEVKDNDTWRLVDDIEKLRLRVGVARWAVVLGGSWGCTLAIAYAQEHPSRVAAMVLRGVCLMREMEVSWLFGPAGGARALNPRAYADFVEKLEPFERRDCRSVLEGFSTRLLSPDSDTRGTASRKWSSYEGSVSSTPLPTTSEEKKDGTSFRVSEWNGETWLLDGQDEKEALAERRRLFMSARNSGNASRSTNETTAAGNSSTAGINGSTAVGAVNGSSVAEKGSTASGSVGVEAGNSFDKGKFSANSSTGNGVNSSAGTGVAGSGWFGGGVPAQAILTCWYSKNGAFMEDGFLLSPERIARIRNIPCVAVQGTSDLICPPITAFDLHQAWPQMRLVLVHGGAHSMYDPGITSELVRATDAFADANPRAPPGVKVVEWP